MNACAIALVLVFDASAFLFPAQWQMQAGGHAAAFEDAAALLEAQAVRANGWGVGTDEWLRAASPASPPPFAAR